MENAATRESTDGRGAWGEGLHSMHKPSLSGPGPLTTVHPIAPHIIPHTSTAVGEYQ